MKNDQTFMKIKNLMNSNFIIINNENFINLSSFHFQYHNKFNSHQVCILMIWMYRPLIFIIMKN